MIGSLNSVNKLPNTRVFIAAEKWMVRSTGVGIFHAPPPRAIIPDAHALGAFENQDACDGKTRYI